MLANTVGRQPTRFPSGGLSHPDLRIAGFENGFCPLFKRGTAAGERL